MRHVTWDWRTGAVDHLRSASAAILAIDEPNIDSKASAALGMQMAAHCHRKLKFLLATKSDTWSTTRMDRQLTHRAFLLGARFQRVSLRGGQFLMPSSVFDTIIGHYVRTNPPIYNGLNG